MKIFFIWLLLLVFSGCSTYIPPDDFFYKNDETGIFEIVSYSRIKNAESVYHIYIEGDGYAFDAYGRPTDDPTPKGTMFREIAFNDNSDNVVYLARPCQYTKDTACSVKYWTGGRFATEVIDSEAKAIKDIVGGNEVILIGYSGGGQIAGLIGVLHPEIRVKKIITIAGNLNHKAWIDFHKLSPLSDSLDLADYREEFLKIPQFHYVGEDDTVIPMKITKDFVENNDLIKVVPASHSEGFKDISVEIYEQK